MIEYTVKVLDNGVKFWFHAGKRHREDGPAIEWGGGAESWYLNGDCHRTDGPAIVRSSGAKHWYLDGKELTEEEHRKATSKPTCDGKAVTVDGVKYTLREVQ